MQVHLQHLHGQTWRNADFHPHWPWWWSGHFAWSIHTPFAKVRPDPDRSSLHRRGTGAALSPSKSSWHRRYFQRLAAWWITNQALSFARTQGHPMGREHIKYYQSDCSNFGPITKSIWSNLVHSVKSSTFTFQRCHKRVRKLLLLPHESE